MSDKTFLSRWSRLKKEQTSAPATDPETLQQNKELATNGSPINTSHSSNPASSDEPPPLTDADMPDINSLSEDSDYSQFLSSGVSDELRNLALRKLFNLPQFNIVDGLNDYDDDFSKMPALSQAVVSKMRSWMQEKQEEVVEEITGNNTPSDTSNDTKEDTTEDNQDPNNKDTDQQSSKPEPKPTEHGDITDYTDDDDSLGDADLEG